MKNKKLLGVDRFIRVMSRGHIVTDRLIETRESKVEDEFGWIDGYLDRIDQYGATAEAAPLRLRRAALQARADEVDDIEGNSEQDKALDQIKTDARELAADANRLCYQAKDAAEARPLAAAALETIEAMERRFREARKDGKNPLAALVKTYSEKLIAAGSLPNSTDRLQAYRDLTNTIGSEQSKCQPCIDELRNAQRAVQTMSAKIELLPKQVGFIMPPGAKDAALLRKRFTTLRDAIGGAYANAVTLDELKQKLAKVVTDAATLSTDIDDARAKTSDVGTMQASVAKRLDAAQTAINNLASGEPKNTLQQELDLLRNAAAQHDLLVDQPAQKSAYFKLDRDALNIMERANKALFDAKSATPEGCKEVDALINQIGDTTTDPENQAICRAALSARFKLQIEIPEGLSVVRLPRLYQIFAQVPPEHVGHHLLERLEIGTEPLDNANYYWKTYKKIVLAPNIDSDTGKDYVRQNGTGAKETLSYFNSTTLHEIGHGVDAKFNVMGDHKNKAGCGQWEQEDIGKVIAAYYAHFFQKYVGQGGGATEADLKSLLRTLLTGGTPTKPPAADAPLGSLLTDWDQISNEPAFTTYCPGIRTAANPWKNRYAAGKRVFVESYTNDWWSYDEKERDNGISSYQWRSPAEWFAEVYALYHVKKVKGYPDTLATRIEGAK